jgi:hypothetical protein
LRCRSPDDDGRRRPTNSTIVGLDISVDDFRVHVHSLMREQHPGARLHRFVDRHRAAKFLKACTQTFTLKTNGMV